VNDVRAMSRLGRAGRSFGRAIRASGLVVYAWPALTFVAADVLLRGPALGSLGWDGRLEYLGDVALMLSMWGTMGASLGSSAALARSGRRLVSSLVAAPAALVMVAMTSLAVAHLSFYSLNRYFADAAMVRETWPLRHVIASDVGASPGVAARALVAVAALLGCVAAQAWRRPRPQRAPRGWVLALPFPAVALQLAMLSPGALDQPEARSSPPDAAALRVLLRALRRPPYDPFPPKRGAFVREPVPVPPLTRAAERNVLVILTESIRADEMCSDPGSCRDDLIDPVAPDRIALTRLRTQAPGTFTTCMVLWTGLEPDTQFPDSHRAPFLWEVARAAGYHTIYVSAHSSEFFRFGLYIRESGIDFQRTAADLQPDHDLIVGADDEKAMAALLAHVGETRAPWYGVLHLANTHALYRTDPAFEPNQPQSSTPGGDLEPFRNRYRNAIALQRRSLGEFLRALRALPSAEDTIVLFLSDHGEPLGDHGEIFHRDGYFEASMHVPGWVLAGGRALSAEERAALSANRARFVYARDIHATVLDALGVWEERSKIPYAAWRSGRSLLRPMAAVEPIAVFANVSGVWGLAKPHFGAAKGERKLISGPRGPFRCYDLAIDPREENPSHPAACGVELEKFVHERFPGIAGE
jgi:hypothetical protein